MDDKIGARYREEIPKADFVNKLRRLSDAIENEEGFEISIAGERINVPMRARFIIEHERYYDEEGVGF